ncbi:TetR/AcrR family transcriptional regulator [Kutzneria sp. CA-103260]|uniref:TetR/AcrR family transcriptional regulator n=1 Tax=Kutzneria sp. CA-103260 TaxID=2802641 RepID=UPI001BA54AFE|nr:TetR/AcrR family transcriptional regulator [Kutzneria sp. CA-103260]QUQ71068.1 TetR family transcriptional regulator [Kutzneria sp. CA-103260]
MPKITGRSLGEHRERTRERIFTALSTLMYQRGFDAISLADIAAAAEVGRTAMYNYFPDKETLLLAYAEHVTEQYMAELVAALAGVRDPVDGLATYVRSQLRHVARNHLPPGTALRSLMSEQSYRHMVEHVSALELILRGILVSGMREGLLPEDDVETLVGLVTACISGRTVAELSGAELDHAVESTVRFVLRGVGAVYDDLSSQS